VRVLFKKLLKEALVHYSQTDLHIWFLKETDHATWENFLLLEFILFEEKPCHDRLKTTNSKRTVARAPLGDHIGCSTTFIDQD